MIITPAHTVFELLAFYVATYHVANNTIRYKNKTISLEDTYDNIIRHKVSFNDILNSADAAIDKDTCVYCELLANTVDHIIPQYHGGTDELLNLDNIAKELGYDSLKNNSDTILLTKGYRLLSRVPRLPFGVIQNMVRFFHDFTAIQQASIAELDEVEGIGETRAKNIRDGLKRMREQIYSDYNWI